MTALFHIFTLGFLKVAFAASNVGFHYPNSPEVPDSIRDASKSVFQLTIAGSAFDPSDERDQLILKINRYVAYGSPTVNRLTDCLDSWIKRTCYFYSTSTVFMGDRPDTIWARASDLRAAFIRAATEAGIEIRDSIPDEEYRKLKELRLDLELADSEGNALFGSGFWDYAVIEHLDPDVLQNGLQREESVSPNTDYVKIRLSKSLRTPPLKFRNVTAQELVGQNLFAVGFPLQTNDREPLGGIDSPGDFEMISMASLDGQHESNFYVKSDCISGMEGGPILDSAGNVLGIIVKSNLDDEKFSEDRKCLVVNFSQLVN